MLVSEKKIWICKKLNCKKKGESQKYKLAIARKKKSHKSLDEIITILVLYGRKKTYKQLCLHLMIVTFFLRIAQKKIELCILLVFDLVAETGFHSLQKTSCQPQLQQQIKFS